MTDPIIARRALIMWRLKEYKLSPLITTHDVYVEILEIQNMDSKKVIEYHDKFLTTTDSFCSCGANHSDQAKHSGYCNNCLKQIT
jgi:hypothetical protein